MITFIKELFRLLTPKQKKNFYLLQVLVILMAFMEILGVASIIPFMTLVGDMSLLKQDTIIAKVFQLSGMNSEMHFVFFLGLAVLLMLLFSSIISMFTMWRIAMFTNKVGTEMADRLYAHYLKQNWLFHSNGSSAQLTKKIATETKRVTNGALMPLMQINAKIVLAFFLSLSIFLFDPLVAIVGLIVFSVAYFSLFRLVRIRLHNNGIAISKVMEQRFRLMNEGFGGIKDVLLLGRDKHFIESFNSTGKIFAYSEGTNQALAQVPRYFMELVTFGSMMMLLLYLIFNHNGNLGVILPILSVYALATFKLLPALQQTYANAAIMKGNLAAFNSIQQDLIDSSKAATKDNANFFYSDRDFMHLKKNISLENIHFKYPSKKRETLRNLNIKIPANSIVGIVGASGSGKSTLIDILLALIEPQQGYLKIDDTKIENKNKRSWQNAIGFVAQSIFLSEGTIAENVAFGIQKDDIDFNRVHHVLKLAHLDEFIETLEEGIDTKVGERGVQLSGGQRQRIGIARALYHEASVLIFDEATSSLDGISEKKIMQSINNLSKQRTIIMVAHRLKTVQNCNKIFFIDDGSIVDEGTYDELIKNNQDFKKMADHA